MKDALQRDGPRCQVRGWKQGSAQTDAALAPSKPFVEGGIVLEDVKYAWRQARKAPGFAVAAITTLRAARTDLVSALHQE